MKRIKIGLIDVDGHNFPNLPLMKISAYHKKQGHDVDTWFPLEQYDKVYMSKVFTSTPDVDSVIFADEVEKGGTGYGLHNKLTPEIEHIYPDYELYAIKDTAYGFLSRGCPRGCDFCIVAEKEGRKSYKVADLSEFWRDQKYIKLLDPNLLACKESIDLLKQLADSRAWVDFTQGLDARLLTDENIHYLNKVNVKMLHFAWDLMDQSDAVLRGLQMYLNKGDVHDERKRRVYVLTNFNTTEEEDLYRIYKLREMKYDPYVMIYDKENASRQKKRIQRWVNNKFIFRSCEKFEDYTAK